MESKIDRKNIPFPRQESNEETDALENMTKAKLGGYLSDLNQILTWLFSVAPAYKQYVESKRLLQEKERLLAALEEVKKLKLNNTLLALSDFISRYSQEIQKAPITFTEIDALFHPRDPIAEIPDLELPIQKAELAVNKLQFEIDKLISSKT